MTATHVLLSDVLSDYRYAIPLTAVRDELSVRTYNALANDGNEFLGVIVEKSEAEILRTPNVGRKGLGEVKEVLGSRGLGLDTVIEGGPRGDSEYKTFVENLRERSKDAATHDFANQGQRPAAAVDSAAGDAVRAFQHLLTQQSETAKKGIADAFKECARLTKDVGELMSDGEFRAKLRLLIHETKARPSG